MSLSDEEIEKRVERAQEMGQKAGDRRPDSRSWGMYAYGDAPPAIGGGVGAFLWFSSEAELLEFIATHLTFFSPGPGSVPVGPVLSTVDEIVEKFKSHKMEKEPSRIELNKELRNFSQIEWWGTRSELFNGESEFCRGVRKSFRDDEDLQLSNGPIVAGEEEDFLDYLETYGI